jgi:hypothetical protein
LEGLGKKRKREIVKQIERTVIYEKLGVEIV